MRDAMRAAVRHARNAMLRSRLVFVPGLLVGAVLFALLRSSPPAYVSTVSFRALQGWERGTEKGLHDFFVTTVLTRDILEPVIEANGLYRSQRARAAYLAVDELREDLDVQVQRWEMPESTLARRNAVAIFVQISFTHSRQEVAERVTHDLAKRIRASSVAASNAKYRVSIARASGAADALSQQLEKTKQTAMAAGAAKRAAEGERQDTEFRLRGALEARTASLLGAEFEREEQALDFEIMDEVVRSTGGRRPGVAVLVALLAATFTSLVFMLLSNVGADLAVDEDDLREAGLRPLVTIMMARRGRS